jgi:hypothetical protein
MTTQATQTPATPATTQATPTPAVSFYNIGGQFSLQDIKFDLLKIIEPYDGYMYNAKDTNQVRSLFDAYLGDLRRANKIQEYGVYYDLKDNAVTFDVNIKIQRDRSAKKLKIHVGALRR